MNKLYVQWLIRMGLRNYIVRRLIIIIPTFLLSSLIIFSMIHFAPGDPIEVMFRSGGHPVDPKIVEEIRRDLGLDQPLYVQYLIWVGKFLRGDLGYSYVSRQAVITQIAERAWFTVELALLSEILALLLAIILGVISAVKHYSTVDNVFSVFALFGYSMPSFWVGLLLIFFFSVSLGWLPVCGTTSLGVELTPLEGFIDHLKHLILPLMVVSLSYTAYYFRLVRGCMLEVLQEQYIATARAKGLKERIVIYKHALKNALLPVVTFVGMSLGFVLAGAVVTETIFSWPGLGSYAVKLALSRDYPGLMGLNMVIILMVLFSNLCTDIVIALIDPRIKY